MKTEPKPPTRQLSLFDAISIGVGIIIGVGIFETSPFIAKQVASPAALIGVWAIGAVISLIGALCYAELATVCPQAGGEYRFLQNGFGASAGFLFSWCSFWIIQPCNIGMMGFVFGRYGSKLIPFISTSPELTYLVLAVGAIVLLTATNLFGLRCGAMVQNILTAAKYLGLILIVAAALFYAGQAEESEPQANQILESEVGTTGVEPGSKADTTANVSASPRTDYALAVVLVLFSFGGWNNISFVVAEMKDARRSAPLALILTVLFVTFIYLAITCSFLWVLGLGGLQESEQVAVDVVTPVLSAEYPELAKYAGNLIAALICLSALGAINGMILTTPRVYSSAGKDHRLFSLLSPFNQARAVPTRAMVLQSLVAVFLTVGFGSYARGTATGFQRLFEFSTPVFWAFVLMVGVSLFAFRGRKKSEDGFDAIAVDRFSVPWYPWLPIVFVVTACLLLRSSFQYSMGKGGPEGWIALGVVVAGAVAAWIDSRVGLQSGRNNRD
jgi:APA family basic amino acid/polyamine antiporter